LNCTGANPPCGQCRACTLTAKDVHPDVIIVESEGGTLKIDQVRGLQQMLALRPYEARYRVAILRRFHEARPTAQDALLKTLEEPSPNTVLILTANAADGLLPTIISRCQTLHLRPLPVEAVRAALEQDWNAPPDAAQTLAQISGGRIGWAIRALQNPDEMDQRHATLDMLGAVLRGNRRERFALVDRLSLDKPALLTLLDTWQGYWRDTLLIASGSQTPVTNYDHIDEIEQLAQRIGTDAAQKALEATRRTANYLDKNANTRLALEVLVLDFP
jgi:DNA polymerase-3 subunit delta'